MKQKLIFFLKTLLRKYLKRDILILKSNWTIKHTADNVFISKAKDDGSHYLPVRYNYHTPKEWQLHYDVIGNSTGILHYSLRIPDEPPFCVIDQQVHLPFSWTVNLEGGSLVGNGAILELKGDIPTDALRLVAELSFISQNVIMNRRTEHRVKLENNYSSKEYSEEYFYGKNYRSYDSDAYHLSSEILSKIEEVHPLTGRLLDVGCATGLLVEYAFSRGLDADGVDFSSWAVEKANERTHGRCRVLNFNLAQSFDFPNVYDIIILHSVLEHLESPEYALELLFNLCKPGGVVYIQTLNSESLMHQIMANDWGGYTDYTHISPWISASWLTDTAKKKGFEIVYFSLRDVWNDNMHDDVWLALGSALQFYPVNILLEEKFGDIIEVILRRPLT